MSVAWTSTFEEHKKRAISFVTTAEPSKWITAVKKLAYSNDVYEIELYRSNRTGTTCYDLCVFVNYNGTDSEEETLLKHFGLNFVNTALALKTPQEMGIFSKNFVRIGPSKEASLVENRPITPDDLYIIYDTIEQGNQLNTAGYAQCFQEYMKQTNINPSQMWENGAYKYFNKLGKTHSIEGGSWLVMPKIKVDENTEMAKITRRCSRYYEQIVEEFTMGCLQDEFITRVTYSTHKGLVKVTNKKTVSFDYLEDHPDSNVEDDEDVFRADKEVIKTFRALQKCRLAQTALKYKPDVFTACKLNTRNMHCRLTLYTGINYHRKMAIANED